MPELTYSSIVIGMQLKIQCQRMLPLAGKMHNKIVSCVYNRYGRFQLKWVPCIPIGGNFQQYLVINL